MAPSICPHFTGTRSRYRIMKCSNETMKAAAIGSVRILSGTAMPAKADDRHPDQIEDRDQHTEAFGAEPVQPAQREFAALIRAEPARAGKEAPPVLLDDLEAAIGPAMALLLEGLVGIGQQAVAVSGGWCSASASRAR